MKKFLATAVLVFASAIAWATPSPKQVESALAAHDYRAARSMVDEVLRDRPDSARAHLLNSYVLLKEGKLDAASNEIKTARQLDTKGDVVGSALFGRTVAELDMAKPKVSAPAYVPPAQPKAEVFVPPPVQQTVQQTDTGHGVFFWLFVLALLGGIGYGIYSFMKKKPQKEEFVMPSPDIAPIPTTPEPAPTPAPIVSTTASPAPMTSTPMYRRAPFATPAPIPAPTQAPVIIQQDNSSSVLGTVAAAGVGILAADALLNAGRHRRDEEAAYERGRRDERSYSSSPAPAPYWDTTPTPAPAPAPRVDYESERESFSSSSRRDDSWSTPAPTPTPSFSSSRDDDDRGWGSSSSSSSSYSSDSSSSSSSDSGSSDW